MKRLLSTLGAFLLVSACSACTFNPCDPKTDVAYCEGNVRWSCPEPGVDQLVPDRWVRTDCATKNQVCITPESGTSICALAETPHPGCAHERSAACESQTSMLSCSQGYATGQVPCRACTADEAGVVRCEGGFGSTCTANVDCGPGLACDGGRCMREPKTQP